MSEESSTTWLGDDDDDDDDDDDSGPPTTVTGEDPTTGDPTTGDPTTGDATGTDGGGKQEGELCSGPSECASGYCYRRPYLDELRCQTQCMNYGLDNDPVSYCENFSENCCDPTATCNGTYCYAN